MHLVKATRTFVETRHGRTWRTTPEEMPEFFVRDSWESTMKANALSILNASISPSHTSGVRAEFDIKLIKVEES